MSARKGEIKINENIAVNEPKNTTKFNKDNTYTTNFNERSNRDYNNTLTQQDVINMTSDNTLNNGKRSTDDYYLDIIA